MITKKLLQALGVGLLALTSCQTPSLYDWGSYEDSVYGVCQTGKEADLDKQILKLSELVEKSIVTHKLIPPGLHAHLGYLHYLQGDVDAANAAFLAEKEAFPESAVFIDGLISRMRSPQATGGSR